MDSLDIGLNLNLVFILCGCDVLDIEIVYMCDKYVSASVNKCCMYEMFQVLVEVW